MPPAAIQGLIVMAFQTREQLSEHFRTLFKTVPDWLPSNVRRVKWTVITANPGTNALGLPCDANEQTGKIVHFDEDQLILKIKPSHYCVVDPALLPDGQPIVVGAKVTVLPYKRKSLTDGLPLDAPRQSETGITQYWIGQTRTNLPGRPHEGYLGDMADQLEGMLMPDGYRTIANALADWSAKDFVWISEDSTITYELHVTITAPGYTGPVTIVYDRGTDTYHLRHDDPLELMMTGESRTPVTVTDIHFDELAHHLSNLAGDSKTWFKVQIVPASSRKAA